MDKIYLVSYDISSDKLRTKVANKLIFYGLQRIQYSVFMGSLRSNLLKDIKQWLLLNVKGKDKLLILPLPPQIINSALSYGDNVVNWSSIINQINTLYID